MKRQIVVAITGASGVTYAVRLIEVLLAAACDVHLTISRAGRTVLKEELDLSVDLENFAPGMLLLDNTEREEDPKLKVMRAIAGVTGESSHVLATPVGEPGQLTYYHYKRLTAPIASGSFPTDGMVICPCSMSTLSTIVHGGGTNLIHRAAEVHLKERRKLILVPRETPLSVIHLRNMALAAEAGAVVLPAMPAFYHGVVTIRDLVDFIVARIIDQLGIENELIRRWGT
ncbi:flavin prenyltransferase UbiX [Thermogutta sp.]|uniref:UbiX family flavin prenyltransferase n=1 Tax=Thermogutta sp. TaxID=1962930 RepID=UPI0032201219